MTVRDYPRALGFVSVRDNDVEVDIREAGSEDRIWMDMTVMSPICKVQVQQPVLMWVIESWLV